MTQWIRHNGNCLTASDRVLTSSSPFHRIPYLPRITHPVQEKAEREDDAFYAAHKKKEEEVEEEGGE